MTARVVSYSTRTKNAGRGGLGFVSARNGQAFGRDATIRRKHVTISQAQLWWSLDGKIIWAPDAQPVLTILKNPSYAECTSLAVIKSPQISPRVKVRKRMHAVASRTAVS